jgi:hypothetical protein
VPTRGAAGATPTLHLTGNAAARVVALDRAGAPLRDVELIGTISIELPAGTASVTVTGLGSSLRKRVDPALGAVTLHEATSPVPVVGWQMHTPLVVAAPSTLLARGATVRLSAPLTEHHHQGVVLAGAALVEQRGVTTMLPPVVGSVAIVLDEEDATCLGDAADSLAVSVAGGALADGPAVVAAGARTLLIYDVLATDNGSEALAVSVAVSAAFTIAGVMGFAGPAESWAHMLSTDDLDTLVENGPLSPTGVSRLRFTMDEE